MDFPNWTSRSKLDISKFWTSRSSQTRLPRLPDVSDFPKTGLPGDFRTSQLDISESRTSLAGTSQLDILDFPDFQSGHLGLPKLDILELDISDGLPKLA